MSRKMFCALDFDRIRSIDKYPFKTHFTKREILSAILAPLIIK